MAVTIWYISKYFEPRSERSPGGRGQLLLEELVRRGFKVVVIASDSNTLVDTVKIPEAEKIKIITNFGLTYVWLKTIKYHVAKSFRRVVSWFHF